MVIHQVVWQLDISGTMNIKKINRRNIHRNMDMDTMTKIEITKNPIMIKRIVSILKVAKGLAMRI
jgi:hypothetical protein